MAIINMRELSRRPKRVIEILDNLDDAEACLITRHGRPLAALVPVDAADAEAFLIAASPELATSRREAERALAEGRTVPLHDLAKRYGVDLDADEALGEAEAKELIQEAAAKAQAALNPENGKGDGDSARNAEDRAPAELMELNRPLLELFADAAPGESAADATKDPSEAPEAVLKVMDFNHYAAERLAEERPTVYTAFLQGAVVGGQFVRDLHELDEGRLAVVRRVARRVMSRAN